ncbi:DUF4232 domain-containing protein [Streptomyces nitrosporeus]|uniref:DUF4232 domain-containing protein n=1 Tax=Streptomyces nitrosporeus TaxID=28894 RepID=UPI00331E69BB
MKPLFRSTALAVTSLASIAVLTACQDESTTAAPKPATTTGAPAQDGAGSASGAPATTTAPDGTDKTGATEGSGDAEGQETPQDEPGTDKSGYGQVCGSNDVVFAARSETQAGGYILITATAKPGISCSLDGLPVVAFGSDGTEASPAEQSVGDPVALSGSATAYAGVNPKTTKDNTGKELEQIIVSAAADDPAPVSLEVGPIVVDDPIVTNWHTAPQDAVPGNGGAADGS